MTMSLPVTGKRGKQSSAHQSEQVTIRFVTLFAAILAGGLATTTLALASASTAQAQLNEMRPAETRALGAVVALDKSGVRALLDEVGKAVEMSDNTILESSGVTTSIVGTGFRSANKVEGRVAAGGDAFRREPRVPGGPYNLSSYWVNEAAVAIYSIDMKDPSAVAALKMLKKTKARWLVDTSVTYEGGVRWRSTLMPGYAWGWYYDPAYIDSGERVDGKSGVRYVFKHRNPYLGDVESRVEVSLDPSGKVTKVVEASRQFSVSYSYSYSASPIKTPAADTIVDLEDFSTAVEATSIPSLLSNLKAAVIADLAWGVSKQSITEAVSRWVDIYNSGGGRIVYAWQSDSAGARFWAVNPINNKTSGWRFSVGKNGQLVVRKY